MALDKKIIALIRKHAIKNAIDYGKARPENVIGKVLAEAKGQSVDEIKNEAKKVVDSVNKMSKRELTEAYKPFEKEFEKRAEEIAKKTEKPNFTIEGAIKGKVATRISPGPNGYMHIGHVKQALISEQIARMYEGKFFRYFDDTNPEACKQEYVDAMMKDHEWLGLKFDKTYYASDFVDRIYEYAKQFIEKGRAYACMCDRETMQKNRFEGKECVHRKQSARENLRTFNDMLGGKFKEGDVAIRLLGNMKAQNTVMRDPVLLRIVEAPHYRVGTKYRVWPTYDFNTPIVDSINGVTDIIRSKEYELRDELSRTILEALGLRVPRMHLEARLNIKGNITQKRDIRKLIEEGRLEGWDDPRLMTIMALRRRGIMPDAIRNFILKLGMTKTDSTVPFSMLLAENKKIINPFAWHLFFVSDPVKLTVKGTKPSKVSMRLLPSGEFGNREYDVGDNFYISNDDSASLKKRDEIRLKDFIDIRILSKTRSSVQAEVMNGEPSDKIIQWVPGNDHVECSVLVPGELVDKDDKFNPDSLETKEGYAEGYVKKIHDQEIVQFERFGYCILDSKKDMRFIFISK